MKPKTLLKHYKTQSAIADEFGFTRAAVSKWFAQNSITYRTQVFIELKTNRLFKATGKVDTPRISHANQSTERTRPESYESWRGMIMTTRRNKAQAQVNKAIRHGQMKPPKGQKCKDCKQPATCYDHRDYRKPLEVDAVCSRCNGIRGPAQPWYDENSDEYKALLAKTKAEYKGKVVIDKRADQFHRKPKRVRQILAKEK